MDSFHDTVRAGPRRSRRLRRVRTAHSRSRRAILEESDTFPNDDDIIVIPDEATEMRRIESSDDEEAVEAKKLCVGTESVTDANCSICFEPYASSGSHRLVCLKCGHLFGESCIQKWLRVTKPGKCPQCKYRARLSDIRRIFAPLVQMVDSAEIEELKRANREIITENEALRLEIARLKQQLEQAEKFAVNSDTNAMSESLSQGK